MKKIIAFLLLLSFHIGAQAQEVKKLDPWQKGFLDIHSISTGKGESTFFVFPDGTTMLVDAGAAGGKKPWAADPKPNGSKAPGEWIARYIQPLLEQASRKKLDYLVSSHYHWDHIGEVNPTIPFNASKDFQLTGITQVADMLGVDKIIDRSYPNYSWPTSLPGSAIIKNYQQFIGYMAKHKGSKIEKFKVGSHNQIKLNVNPQQYPSFQVRNIAANGVVWTGVDTVSRNYIPEGTDPKRVDENILSVALRVSYGKFDFFTGGDVGVRGYDEAGPLEYWKDMETPIAMVTGPVEAMKANHHANYDANSVRFLSTLRPRVIVVQTLGASQPSMNIYRSMISKNIYPGQRDIFITNLMQETKTAFDLSAAKSDQGHVLIRVYATGEYEVFNLDDSREGHLIKARFGKYQSN
jgi:beta-lactamase superfamily II metal-dependent hydrolase